MFERPSFVHWINLAGHQQVHRVEIGVLDLLLQRRVLHQLRRCRAASPGPPARARRCRSPPAPCRNSPHIAIRSMPPRPSACPRSWLVGRTACAFRSRAESRCGGLDRAARRECIALRENGRRGSGSGKVARARLDIAARSASHPAQRKREAPLTSVPRSSSSCKRGASLPVMPSMCSINSRMGMSRITTGVIEMVSAASELSLTRTFSGRDMLPLRFQASINA